MAITTSRVGLVIDTLIALLNASPVFEPPVAVLDGPQTDTNTMWNQAVVVGFDGVWKDNAKGQIAPGTEYAAGLINQQLRYVGNTTVLEELEIPCAAEAWSGDPTCKTVRDQCLTMLAGVETVIRTDPTLGIDGSTVAELRVGNLYYVFDGGGNLAAKVPFTVHVTSILPTV